MPGGLLFVALGFVIVECFILLLFLCSQASFCLHVVVVLFTFTAGVAVRFTSQCANRPENRSLIIETIFRTERFE